MDCMEEKCCEVTVQDNVKSKMWCAHDEMNRSEWVEDAI